MPCEDDDEEAPDAEKASTLTVALQVLGASAGLSALAAFVGAATIWIRFDALRLPADQAVTELPQRLLLIVGAHALLPAFAFGAVAALALSAIPQTAKRKPTAGFWVALAIVTVLGLVAVIAAIGDIGEAIPVLTVLGIAIVGVVAIVAGARATNLARRHVAMIVLAAFSVCGAAIAVVRTQANPRLEPAAILLKGKPPVAGFLVGESGDRVYVAPLPGDGSAADPFADAAIRAIVEIPRAEVTRLATRRPTGLRNSDPGRDQAQTMLADLQAQQTPPPNVEETKPIASTNPVADFAPLAHLHAGEKLWPMDVEDYLGASVLAWAHRDGCDFSVAAADHVRRSRVPTAASTGKLEPARLGAGTRTPYRHRVGSACADGSGSYYEARQITRPFETTGRPRGLPLEEGFYLDVADAVSKGAKRTQREGSQVYLRDVPIYTERHGEPPPKGVASASPKAAFERITYWFFYGRSQPPGPNGVLKHFVHEGDWERVSVLLELVARDSYRPISVRFHSHEENRDVPWYAVRRVAADPTSGDTHPVVYIAKLSHASYPRAGDYEEQGPRIAGKVTTAHDDAIACPDCPQWRTWELLVDAEAQPWYGFGGAWGKVGSQVGTTGPLGPSARKTCKRATCPKLPAAPR